MPRKRKTSIGRTYKASRKGKGTPSATPLPSPTTVTPSPIRPGTCTQVRNGRKGTTIPRNIQDEMGALGIPTESKRKALRYAIYYQFVFVLDCPYHEHWSHQGGTIAIIRKALDLRPNQRRVVRRTLEEIMRCLREGKEFDGHISNNEKLGRKILILPGSIEEALIANWMDSHCGFRMTTYMVNEHRRQQDDVEVSRYAVMSAFYRLNPKVDVLSKVVSGGNNEN